MSLYMFLKGVIIIKHIFNKSIFLIIFYVSVSIVSCIGFSKILNSYNFSLENFNMTSANGARITIYSDNENKNNINIRYLEQFLKSQSEDILLYKDDETSFGKGIYISGNVNYPLNINKGRFFNEDDFTKNTNSLLIEESVDNDNYIKDYFYHENNQYNIIGVFSNRDKGATKTVQYYYNLFAQNNLNEDINGTYILNAGEHTEKILNKFISYINNLDNDLEIVNIEKIQTSKKDILKESIYKEPLIIYSIIICILLLVLNTFSSTSRWLYYKRKEIYIRKLVGATDYQIKLRLLIEYLIVILFSCILGIVVSVLVVKFIDLPILISNITIKSAIVSTVFCLVIGILIGSVFINRILKRQIIDIMR